MVQFIKSVPTFLLLAITLAVGAPTAATNADVATADLATKADATLLRSPQIRQELKLPHNVSLKIKQLLNELAEIQIEARKPVSPPQTYKQRSQESTAKIAALHRRALNYLNVPQKRRLGQITLQRPGALIFNSGWSPWINKYLGLSAGQSKRLRVALNREFERYVSRVRTLMRADAEWYGTLDRKRYAARYAAHDKKYQQINNDTARNYKAIVDSILTRSQQAKWKALIGKPFYPCQITYDTRQVPFDA